MTRRAVLTGLLASLLVGPAGAAINQPFGAHTFSYAPGSIRPDHVSQSVQDQAVRDFYDAWKGQYLKQGCGAGRYYVATSTQPGNLTVSEGHGYGMVSLRFKGEAVILKPWQAVDPVVHGMRVVVDALSGPGGIDVTIPAGARAGGVGWQANSALTQWTYTDPAGHGGITRVVVKDRSRVTDGLVRWIIKGRGGAVVLPDAQEVRSAVVVGDPLECAGILWNPPTGARPRCGGDGTWLGCR
ncbi:MAG: hypothetical protein E6J81_16245 [Deltaproteobacteria bacterium]|nr:MAG: hypothetical protein E6J81_16245 [Deltaproteobacteria bacterium]